MGPAGDCLIVCAAVLADPVAAEPAEPAEPAREEIIVTGERISRSLRETASSVVVLTGETIDDLASPDRIEDLFAFIPNVQAGSGGEGPTIRGMDTTGPTRDLPAFLGGTRPRTTLIVDGRAVGSSEFVFGVAPIWDLDRVEVYRTPQSTTQGRNSIAGAIFVHSEDPTFEWEGAARAIAGDLRTRQLSAMVSGPLATDTLAVRLAADYRKARPASEIADTMRGADPNRDEFGLLRVKLLATPPSIPGARVELTYAHVQSQMPQVEGVRAPFRERRDPRPGYGIFATNVDSLTASIGYRPTERLAFDAILSAGNSDVQRYAPPGAGETRIDSRDWSAEAVVNWEAATGLHATGGISRNHVRLDQFIDLSALVGRGEFDDRQNSLGLFGEVSWPISSRASLVAGLRYQRDRQRRNGTLGRGPAATAIGYGRTFEAWLPKLSASYDLSPTLRIGALVQRAYNPGGTTLRFDTGAADEYGAESLWNYELFARATLAGGALRTSANLFFNAIRNAQRWHPIEIIAPSGFPVTFADMFNVPKARSYGLEASVDWRATQRLTLRGALGLLETRIVEAGTAAPQLEGKHFQRSPHVSASAGIVWRPIDRFSLSAQARINSAYFSDDFETSARHIDGSARVDARADWRVGRIELFGYARNLLDTFYLTYLFTPELGTAGDPREVGVGIEARF